MTGGPSGSAVHVRRRPDIGSAEACAGTFECAVAGALDHALLFLWFIMLLVIALGTLQFVPRARELCAEERDRTVREYEAFGTFLDRINEVSPLTPDGGQSPPASAPVLQLQTTATSDKISAVTEAYEETVMDVMHFEEDYGESLFQHMTAELGEEVALGVRNGGPFTDHLKGGIVETARTARDQRENFLGLLEGEAESLEDHARDLRRIAERVDRTTPVLRADQSYDELVYRRDELQDARETLEAIIDERQADRTDNRVTCMPRKTQMHLQEYLYLPMAVTYPVVAEATELLSRVNITETRIEDELIYRG